MRELKIPQVAPLTLLLQLTSVLCQDVQWNDIDYMRDGLDFTVDQSRFGELAQLVNDLHDNGQHYVMRVVSYCM